MGDKTMTDYANLSEFKGKMYRAAIDCWMADQDFTPSWGNDRSYNKWGWAPYQYHRPDENGAGGGTSVGYGDGVNCEAAFDQIRSAIDSIVSPWLSLPDGSGLDTYKTSAIGAGTILGNSRANGPELESSRAQVASVASNNLKGKFVAPFVDKYCAQLLTISHGLGNGCGILASSYGAEEALWPAARIDVVNILTTARDAWATVAETKAAATKKATLSIVAAVAGGVAAVVTGGVAIAATGVTAAAASAAAVSGTLGALGGATSVALAALDAETAVSGDSYSSILDSLSSTLGKLSSTINDQDGKLGAMLSDMDALMSGSRGDYDLDFVTLGDYPQTDGTIQMDETSTSLIADGMDRVADLLSNAESTLGVGPSSNPSQRPSGIGVSVSGTFNEAWTMFDHIRGCLIRTGDEYGRGKSLFNATVAEFFQTDADAGTTVDKLREQERAITEVTW